MLRSSRLPRSPSINVRFAAPGHANPYFIDRARLVDPSHPAAKLALRHLPSFVSPQFTIRAFPNAVLQEPIEFVPINPLLATGLVRARTTTHRAKRWPKWWSNLDAADTQQMQIEPDVAISRKRPTWTTFHEKEGRRRWDNFDAMKRHVMFVAARQLADARLAALAARGRHNLGLLFHTPKKATSNSCVVRRRLRSKITAAIALVVSRNADAVHAPRVSASYPPLDLISRPLQQSERLVLQGWTYLVIPDLAVYKMPLPNLVQAVRKALLSLNHQANHLESTWSALPRSNARSPRMSLLQTRHKVATKSHFVPRPRTGHPHPTSIASARAQELDLPHEPVKHKHPFTPLYASRPIFLKE